MRSATTRTFAAASVAAPRETLWANSIAAPRKLGDARFDAEQVVDHGRREIVDLKPADGEDQPLLARQRPVLEAELRAAIRCGRAP